MVLKQATQNISCCMLQNNLNEINLLPGKDYPTILPMAAVKIKSLFIQFVMSNILGNHGKPKRARCKLYPSSTH